VEFRDESANPSATRRWRLNGSVLEWLIEDARTNSVIRPLSVSATTTGTPAANIGVGLRFRAESADEAPSDFGALDFSASDVGSGTEDTRLDILARIAGAALTSIYRFQATGAFRAIFTHANTAESMKKGVKRSPGCKSRRIPSCPTATLPNRSPWREYCVRKLPEMCETVRCWRHLR